MARAGISAWGLALGLSLTAAGAWAQAVNVTGRVVLEGAGKKSAAASTVVWLVPIGAEAASFHVSPIHATLEQKDKTFIPHMLVITRGSTVEFPNHDPWFHNVFSLFNGKRFDLGLYEAGSSRTVHFDREGISYIFCNIHPEMSAVVVVLPSSYFVVPDKQGVFSIAQVPPGRYMVHVWSEGALPSTLQALSHEVQIGDNYHSLGTIALHLTAPKTVAHKNKYGQDYEPATPSNGIYIQP